MKREGELSFSGGRALREGYYYGVLRY